MSLPKMMRVLVRVLAGLAALVVVAAVSVTLAAFLIYKSEWVTAGSAYGFVVGESRQQVFDRATKLRDAREIAEIRRSPNGSAEVSFGASELAEASHDRLWVMALQPRWYTYRDTITLEFKDDRLFSIYRFRSCCELP